MWHQLWIPVLIPTLIIKSNCDVNKTDTENHLFIRHGHAEANYDNEKVTKLATEKIVTEKQPTVTFITTVATTERVKVTRDYDDVTEDVMFIPNSREAVKRDDDEDLYNHQGIQIKDIMRMRTVNDAVNKKKEKVDETAKEDIVFISGKNSDYIKPEKPEIERKNSGRHYEESAYKDSEDYITTKPKLDCSNLDCNNDIQSVCGTKYVEREWKYRLFLNECFFRKVNCGFTQKVNRYKEVSMDKCRNIGSHITVRPFIFKPKPYKEPKNEQKKETVARRSSISRRSMTMSLNGRVCSHPCPVSCPKDYEPTCALSETGQRRVFLNHCKLDLDSCINSVAWHTRPLAECVGGKKADMRQNRGFIDWMHRVGIVNNKGRLVLE